MPGSLCINEPAICFHQARLSGHILHCIALCCHEACAVHHAPWAPSQSCRPPAWPPAHQLRGLHPALDQQRVCRTARHTVEVTSHQHGDVGTAYDTSTSHTRTHTQGGHVSAGRPLLRRMHSMVALHGALLRHRLACTCQQPHTGLYALVYRLAIAPSASANPKPLTSAGAAATAAVAGAARTAVFLSCSRRYTGGGGNSLDRNTSRMADRCSRNTPPASLQRLSGMGFPGPDEPKPASLWHHHSCLTC